MSALLWRCMRSENDGRMPPWFSEIFEPARDGSEWHFLCLTQIKAFQVWGFRFILSL
jgi:hypothetical protein